MQALQHELKKLIPLTLFFFLSFAYIIAIVDLLLEDYSIDGYSLSKALIAALIAAKTVAILDMVLKSDRWHHLPRYVGLLIRTFLYTLFALFLSLIEGFLEAYHKTRALPTAITEFLQTETFHHLLAVTLCVAIVFFIHNLWQEIDNYLGRGSLWKLLRAHPSTTSDRSR
jgi:hypothetical protein